MNTDYGSSVEREQVTVMDVYGEETGQIIACAHEVINTLGHGLLEKPYENALVREFRLRGIGCLQQPRYPVNYKGERVGEFVPDLVVYSSVIVDLKTIDRIATQETAQVLNYLRITGLRVGLILNFSRPRLETRRVAL
jgi:GxxExxY protein